MFVECVHSVCPMRVQCVPQGVRKVCRMRAQGVPNVRPGSSPGSCPRLSQDPGLIVASHSGKGVAPDCRPGIIGSRAPQRTRAL
eukprot:12410205-Karenia_brevis.AAC.1